MPFSQMLLPEFEEEMKNTRKRKDGVPDDKFRLPTISEVDVRSAAWATHMSRSLAAVGMSVTVD